MVGIRLCLRVFIVFLSVFQSVIYTCSCPSPGLCACMHVRVALSVLACVSVRPPKSASATERLLATKVDNRLPAFIFLRN